MDKKILKILIQRRKAFVPSIFTEKQFDVIVKYSKGLSLFNSEKKALYTSITKKIEALNMIYAEQAKGEYYIYGVSEIIPSRLAEAKALIDKYSELYSKIFISGSFLFSKEFGDIDIFIMKGRGYKEVMENNMHLVFLSEKKLQNPVFQSASLIAVSNFMIPKRIKKKKLSLSGLMSMYHESVIESMRKEKKPEALRNLIFYHSLFCRNKLISPKELKERSENITLLDIDLLIKNLCTRLFSKSYLYVEIHEYIKTLKESIRSIKSNSHLIRYRDAYEEMIYGRQRSKAETA